MMTKQDLIKKNEDFFCKDLIVFASTHRDLYVYGAGSYGRCCAAYLIRNGYEIKAFITSNGGEKIDDLPVIKASEVLCHLNVDDGIVLGMRGKLQDEVQYIFEFPCEILEMYDKDFTISQMLAYGLLDTEKNILDRNISNDEWKSILVIQLEKTYGDMLWSTAFLRELRNSYPLAEICMVINEKYTELYELSPYIDKLWLYHGFETETCITEDMKKRVSQFADNYFSERFFDAVFLPRLLPVSERDGWENIMLMQSARARYRFGHAIYVERNKKILCDAMSMMFTKIVRHRKAQHEALNDMQLLSAVGVTEYTDQKMETWLNEEDWAYADSNLPQGYEHYIAVAPVGSTGNRTWDARKYGEVLASVMQKRKGMYFVVLGGDDAVESAVIIESYLKERCVNLTGRTTLRQAAAVIGRCDLYVGADTGLMHMASAQSTPIVMLSHVFEKTQPYFGGTVTRTGPWQVTNRVLAPKKGLEDCEDYCKRNSHCINQITASEVEAAILEVLSN